MCKLVIRFSVSLSDDCLFAGEALACWHFPSPTSIPDGDFCVSFLLPLVQQFCGGGTPDMVLLLNLLPLTTLHLHFALYAGQITPGHGTQ